MGKIVVGIADQKLCKAPDELATYALGSCVGICMIDMKSHIAGLAHIMLPDSKSIPDDKNKFKFADSAIELLYHNMVINGASAQELVAKLAGGANMFGGSGAGGLNIGERNIAAAKAALKKINVPIIAEDIGLDYGRTVYFSAESGAVQVISGLKGTKVI